MRHGGCEDWNQGSLMLPVSTAATTTTVAPSSPSPPPAAASAAAAGAGDSSDAAAVSVDNNNSSPLSPAGFRLKDGRKIRVGDCALFKPPQDSPPFIGIIRKLTVNKPENPSLEVNWLYRPSDVKLGKGISLEAAPNEVFYSFHKDEILAASLLHPCKVAFLRKGVELPSGISSFVCRRVYDIENKCLWWLTDKDYINERQEEVDKLLDKTRLEMHGVVQSGGRSPKTLNGPISANQVKPSSDNTSSSQVKGKKRERSDQSADPSKRERLSKPEDVESGQSRVEHMLKSEIAKITDKGGLVDFEGVEKLVQLMQPENADKKIDLASRIMLVDVIAVTDRFDCLGRFVQLRGLPVLDEWLQEVHKGKIGDGSSPKESDKSVEEFLLALLRALDKLPVNLHALQCCNVGKSVNHLRSHKNAEIQKKARSLVDMWKKRVAAEMNMNDAKSGSGLAVSWPSKPAPSEVSHIGNRKSGGSAEAGMRSSVTQPSAPKNVQAKLGSSDGIAKSSAMLGSVKPGTTAGGNSKDQNSRMSAGTGTSDVPLTPIKEERSSSSSQSQTNSQSCSSDHAKTIGSSCREDARSSTAGSVTVSKSSSGASRHRKSSNGVHGSAASGVNKESGPGKVSSSNRNVSSEKGVAPGAPRDKVPEIPLGDQGLNQRLIVRLPNTGRSPSRGGSGGSFEDNAVSTDRVSPPAEKRDSHDRRLRGRSEARSNSVSNVNPNPGHGKDGLGEFDEGNGLPACDELQKVGEDGEKAVEVAKVADSSVGDGPRSEKAYEGSLSSINALVESCVKFSEAGASASPEDDVGMNLLASVAAGEILKSDNVSTSSSQRNSPAAEESCSGNDGKSKQTGEEAAEVQCQPTDGSVPSVTVEKCNSVDLLQAKNEQQPPHTPNLSTTSGDVKVASVGCEVKKEESDAFLNSSSNNVQQADQGQAMISDVKASDPTCDTSVAVLSFQAVDKSHSEIQASNQSFGLQGARNSCVSDLKSKTRILMFNDDKKIDIGDETTMDGSVAVAAEPAITSPKIERDVNYRSAYPSLESAIQKQTTVHAVSMDQKPLTKGEVHNDALERESEDVSPASCNIPHLDPKGEVHCDAKAQNFAEQKDRLTTGLGSSMSDQNGGCPEGNVESKEATAVFFSHVELGKVNVKENESSEKSSGHKLDGIQSEGMEDRHTSGASASVSTRVPGMSIKLDFDLNEGFPSDDGNQGEPAKPAVQGISSAVNLSCPLPIPITSMSGSFSPSITVAAAAKGPFVPPENPLRSKGEPGWKGSAATSAFRPAEPRRNLEMPLNAGDISSVDTAASKQGRPPLDFDLNVPDERVLEDVASQNFALASCSESGARDRSTGGLDLDLNRVDESPDPGPFSATNSSRFDIPTIPSRPTLPGAISNGALSTSRDFDLNNGPGLDEVGAEAAPRSQPIRSSLPFQATIPGVRMNGPEFGNFSSWFPPANSYSAITVPSILPGRGEQGYAAAGGSQRILTPGSSTPFGPEMFRGPVLSSSPAVPFPPAAPFQYPGFPFETSFPLSSNTFSGASTAYVDSSSGGALCFPNIPSQLVGPAGIVSSYARPYVMSVPGCTSNGSDNRKWGGQLDLNAGPGGIDTERRDERLPSGIRQLPVPGSPALAEEQLKMYQVGGASNSIFKRKEPDGGWDASDRFSYKQPSRQ